MSFADLDAQGWAIVISAIGVVLLQVVTIIVNAVTAVLSAHRDSAAAARVEQVRVQQAMTAQKVEDHTQFAAKKLDDVVAKVEAVHIATNSLTDRLVETTRSEAHAAGVKEEQDKAKGAP